MSGLLFMFRRKFSNSIQDAYNILGYQPEEKELSERLYGVYIVVILLGWLLAMLGWASFTVSNVLRGLALPPSAIDDSIFFALALWLVLTPGLAFRSYNLYRFSLADIDLLSNMPVPPALVAVGWFIRSLWNVGLGIFVLVCAILGGSFSYLAQQNDWLGFALALASGVSFALLLSALRWTLALLRYRPGRSFRALVAYGLSIVGFGLLVLLPQARYLFWPASLTSYLVVGHTTSANDLTALAGAMAGLLGTTIVVLVAMYLVARKTLLAPAFEGGRIGAQLRQSQEISAGEARLQRYLSRRTAKQANQTSAKNLQGAKLIGTTGTLLYRQLVRLTRLPPYQVLWNAFRLVGSGAVTAFLLAWLSQPNQSFAIILQVIFFANYLLMTLGTGLLRRELGYFSFWASWPVTRQRYMLDTLVLGFGLPALSGEVVLLVAGASVLGWGVVGLWLLLWPLLISVNGLVALLIYQYQLKKWPATPETVPKTGIGTVIIVGLIWLAVAFFGPFNGILITISILTGGSAMLRSA